LGRCRQHALLGFAKGRTRRGDHGADHAVQLHDRVGRQEAHLRRNREIEKPTRRRATHLPAGGSRRPSGADSNLHLSFRSRSPSNSTTHICEGNPMKVR
jgi:hypothetical protein